MRRTISLLVALLLLLCPLAMAETAATPAPDAADSAPDEGYTITDKGIEISLWENASTGYEWSYEIDDETLLSYDSERRDNADAGKSGGAGAPSMHIWSFVAEGSGEVLLSFYYERPWSEAEEDEGLDLQPMRMLCYILTIADGKVTECAVEDLSESDDGDGEAVVQYQGETGGVPLEIPDGMTETQSDEGTVLTSQDGLTKYLINYEPDDSAEELFEKLKDDESAADVYDDAEQGISVISCAVDKDSDIPSVTLVYYIPDGIEEYTGYRAPQGGVLHVHITYLLGSDDGAFEEGEPEDGDGEDAPDWEEEDYAEDDGEPAVG